ncbi:uncharacterized protein [Oncorhynchus clarkii lewisi]|uniref:uncharacterized protein isoform X2 n=1 Tax=Oncorhynchus clarkii lewisi TaxID=490388 RepID=UPI0039B8AA10
MRPAAMGSRPSPSPAVRTLTRTCPCSLPTLVTQAAVSAAVPASFLVTWRQTHKDRKMENPSFRFTPSQELVLKATMQAVKVAADGPPASGAQGPPVRAKKWEEVEAEARARVVSEGGDPGAEMVVLSRCTVQFGKYRGQTFKWMMENDVGYMMHLVTVHQKERERARSVSQHPLMANKDALTRAPIRPSLRWSGSTGHTRKLKSCPPSQARRARPLSALGSTSGTRCRTCMRLRVQTG